MAANLVVAPEASADLDAGYDWYEECRVGLGEEFLGCVDQCIHQILRMPRMYAVVYRDYRRATIRRFPYVLFYEYDEPTETVTLYGVFHTARDPKKWRDRLN